VPASRNSFPRPDPPQRKRISAAFAPAEPQHVAQQRFHVAVGRSGKARFFRAVAVLRMAAGLRGDTARRRPRIVPRCNPSAWSWGPSRSSWVAISEWLRQLCKLSLADGNFLTQRSRSDHDGDPRQTEAGAAAPIATLAAPKGLRAALPWSLSTAHVKSRPGSWTRFRVALESCAPLARKTPSGRGPKVKCGENSRINQRHQVVPMRPGDEYSRATMSREISERV